MSRVAYYGGTFDPPHIGHHQIVETLARSPEITQILVVPTSQNPLKAANDFLSAEDRRKLMMAWMKDLELSLSEEEFSKITLCLEEIQKEGPSYTLDTFKEFHRKGRISNPIALVLGADSIGGLERWKNIEELLQLVTDVWVFPRKDSQLEPQAFPATLRGLVPVRWMPQRVADISSTEIRKLWQEHREIHPHSMSPQCSLRFLEILGHQGQ